mmetsp:Transcript_44644/g.115540  ORF Transcript_44644/g.115540 Transcript_44644/m.115540 type:complete len:122 (-) Transcript_44644:234-599(-)|eukprot:jgi/Tetstr1/460025/TSEL_005345.t1
MTECSFAERLTAYLDGAAVEKAVGDFMAANMKTLTFTEVDGEQDIESYGVFVKFTQLVQEKLQDFLDSERLSHEDFHQQCQLAADSGSEGAALLSRLLAMLDYNAFMDSAMDFSPPADEDD